MNALLWSICILCLTLLILSFILKRFDQPYLIAYIIAGILLGPHITGVFSKVEEIEVIGELGILLLMFFLGLEINIPNKRHLIIKPFIAQGMKVLLGFGFATLIGYFLELDLKSITLIAILFFFNSTAVVTEYLKKFNLLNTGFGSTIFNILLLQDILLAPVLTLLNAWGGEEVTLLNSILPLSFCIAIFFLFKKIRNVREIKLPDFFNKILYDHDLQLFIGLLICMGFGLLADLVGLSSALGSFIAGVLVGKLKVFNWLEHSLTSFKVFFVALFFVSIGLRLDLKYFLDHKDIVLIGTLFVLISNSLMSAIIFRLLKYDWKNSLYGGALLSQTGEFGILALTIAYKTGIIHYDLYKSGLGITCLTLLFSTIWIAVLRKVISRNTVVSSKIRTIQKYKNY
ncbi:cation:proton antiporter [Epilithonimonas hungarica]|uniref:Transporter, CPA2 family n=1 Tax=Epilithonimonas hungarica TaxID=454006 RepID=A0A1G7TS31_9FLAO|nr:cation:proton antiporter [Epilithonimonas hungarica]MDP9955189.1 CPA2 family monovalent cation:H+ antiporter-2 [Epilithonimonas hungarica]MPT31952.1 cation:proton antiporter [Chryseobacterium sp.]SDG38047.1 transporter, CPA2 family [Epilithonimonas hungarica]